MSALLKGVDIHTLPPSLESYVQQKTASGLGKIRLIPLAFPVFVMNPFEYQDSFKGVLQDTQENGPLALIVNSSECPAGEIWEVTNIAIGSNIQANLYLFVLEGGSPTHRIASFETVKVGNWQGNYLIKEGQAISFVSDVNGTLGISIGGRIKYA